MEGGGAILAVIILVAVIVLSTIGLTFLLFGADTLESKERLTPDMEISIEEGVPDTTFVYRKHKQ